MKIPSPSTLSTSKEISFGLSSCKSSRRASSESPGAKNWFSWRRFSCSFPYSGTAKVKHEARRKSLFWIQNNMYWINVVFKCSIFAWANNLDVNQKLFLAPIHVIVVCNAYIYELSDTFCTNNSTYFISCAIISRKSLLRI